MFKLEKKRQFWIRLIMIIIEKKKSPNKKKKNIIFFFFPVEPIQYFNSRYIY